LPTLMIEGLRKTRGEALTSSVAKSPSTLTLLLGVNSITIFVYVPL
jgi:hypothetical protein